MLGTIIEATLRPEDLLPAFKDTLESLDTEHQHSGLIRDAVEMLQILEHREWTDEEYEAVSYLVNEELPDALNEFAPPYTYFGAHPGDGADFGFWPDVDALEEEMRYRGIDIDIDGREYKLLVDDALLVSVNDHGNVSVYKLATGDELWSCV